MMKIGGQKWRLEWEMMVGKGGGIGGVTDCYVLGSSSYLLWSSSYVLGSSSQGWMVMIKWQGKNSRQMGYKLL